MQQSKGHEKDVYVESDMEDVKHLIIGSEGDESEGQWYYLEFNVENDILALFAFFHFAFLTLKLCRLSLELLALNVDTLVGHAI